jgi:hypothetical protein
MTNKVFIPQLVERWDHKTHGFVPVHDFTSAALHGNIVTILDKADEPLFLNTVMPKIREKLEDFGYDDYFVAVGDPSVIAICSGIILRQQDYFKMLKWDKKMALYIPLEIRP